MQWLNEKELFVRQVRELAELIGIETRNKYQIQNAKGVVVAQAYEEKRGFLGFLFNQLLGHWRSFTIHFFDQNKNEFMTAHHPFRFFFQRLEIKNSEGRMLGALQQRWSIISKCFDMENARGEVVMRVRSPLWRPWTFPFYGVGQRQDQQLALVAKKWSGLFSEALTDRDNFLVEFGPMMSADERQLLLASALFIDLQYFERKANHR